MTKNSTSFESSRAAFCIVGDQICMFSIRLRVRVSPTQCSTEQSLKSLYNVMTRTQACRAASDRRNRSLFGDDVLFHLWTVDLFEVPSLLHERRILFCLNRQRWRIQHGTFKRQLPTSIQRFLFASVQQFCRMFILRLILTDRSKQPIYLINIILSYHPE